MLVEVAELRDIRSWLDLAAEVEALFGNMLDKTIRISTTFFSGTSIADPHTACVSVMDLLARLSWAECRSHHVDPIDRSIGLAGSQ